MNSNFTTPLLSFVPMLKKSLRIFCYMGLFFIASVSYASVPTDYGSPAMQRTPTDNSTSNYLSWCIEVSTTTAPSVRNYNPNYVDNNGFRYIQYSTYFYSVHESDTCDNYLYNNDQYTTFEGYQLTPETSWIGDKTAGWSIYTITELNTSIDLTENIVYFDYAGDENTVTATTTTKALSFGGENYQITKYELPEMDFGYNTWLLKRLSIDSSNVNFYGLIATNEDIIGQIQYASDLKTYMENLYFYAPTNYWNSSSTSYINNDCPTCTRIIETSPYNNQIVVSGEANFPYNVDFYISQDDFDDASIAYIRYPYISVTVSNGTINETHYAEISSSGNHEYIPTFSNVTANGTYQVTIELKTKLYSNFLENLSGTIIPGNKSYINDVRVFYVGTTTRSSADGDYYVVGSSGGLIYSAYSGITCSMNLLGVLNADWWTCAMEYVVATLVPNNETAKTYMMEKLDTLLYLPPWGYVTYANSLFSKTDSQTLPFIAISFPEGSPLRGSTLNLELTSNLQNTTTFLSATTPETMTDDTLTTFLYYWEMMWYVMFAWWFLSEMFNSFGSSPIRTSFNDRKQYQRENTRKQERQQYKSNMK